MNKYDKLELIYPTLAGHDSTAFFATFGTYKDTKTAGIFTVSLLSKVFYKNTGVNPTSVIQSDQYVFIVECP